MTSGSLKSSIDIDFARLEKLKGLYRSSVHL